MTRRLALFLLMLAPVGAMAFSSRMRSVKLHDGETVQARLCLPEQGEVKTVVVIVHGTGPNTYLNKRPGFNYYDALAEGFCQQGVGFYTYDRRGCRVGDKPPMFVEVDSVRYNTYTPQNDALDVEAHVASLLKEKRFRHCKLLLYGISEGTMIAPLVAERGKVRVDGLLLHGYVNENMYDIIRWQHKGYGGLMVINEVFDKNDDKAVSRAEYEAAELAPYRTAYLQDVPFDSLDVVKNERYDIDDVEFVRKQINFDGERMDKIATGDQKWIWDNYMGGVFPLTIAWFRQHFRLEANKTRLLRLDLPIHIFHGTHDGSVPVEGVYDVADRFRACGKTNLTTHIFERHNHDLNFLQWLTAKTFPQGLQAIFDTAAEL